MPQLETYDTFNVSKNFATAIYATPQRQAKILAMSEAIYYKNTSAVSSSDTELAKGSSVTTSETLWIVSKGAESSVLIEHLEGPTFQEVTDTNKLTVGGTAAITGTTTPTGGIVAASANPGGYVGAWTPNTAEAGTDTTPAEKKLFVGSFFLPVNKKIKGIGYLVGSVGGTNKVVAGLFSSAGALLAHSSETTEGATVGTAKEIQELNLTAEYEAVGPAQYFIGITMNGNTARIRTIPSNTIGSNLLSEEITLASKNVLAKITAPTAVAQGKAPVAWYF